MVKENGRKWDGRSRVSNEVYRKRYDEIFGKKKKKDTESDEFRQRNRHER